MKTMFNWTNLLKKLRRVSKMSIRIRLVISHIAMIVIPVMLSFITISMLSSIFIDQLKNTYDIKFRESPVKEISDKNSFYFSQVKRTASFQPEKLEDKKYLSELDKNLSKVHSAIIVEKNNEIIYSSEIANNLNLSYELVKLEEDSRNRDFYKNHLLMKHLDFSFKDKTLGTAFIITDITPGENILKGFIVSSFFSIILIFILTDGILSYWISKSIIKPLESLKKGANQIKEGNLNFKITSNSNDEIGELCLAFEEMRSKLKESVELQIQYDNNRKELISNISHDLKTPVTAIKGYVEGIMDGVADNPDKMKKYIQTIYVKACDMANLIDELFLFSKLDLNKLPFNFVKVDLIKYLEDSTEELQFDLEKHNIKLNFFNNASASIFVLIDIERIKRVIMNIIQNSTKYMNKDSGEINIYVKEDEDTVTIQISDNGQGISKESLPYIFDRFYRADPSRNSSTGGSGLGLAIVKKIIEEHNGKVWADSEENVGTSIFFTLKKFSVQNISNN